MADEQQRLSRRRLLGAGGAGAASFTLLGAAGLGPAKAKPASAADRPNVLVIAVDGVRADFIGAYDDADDRADTPNLDDLASDSLRFERAFAESIPAIASRRALITGMRAYPFRDWLATDGMPSYPGWNRIRSYQPSLPGTLESAKIETVWISDTPLLDDARFKGVYRKPGGSAGTPQVQRFLQPVVPGGASTSGKPPLARFVDEGIAALGELKSKQPFFLAVDAFDRVEATEPTPVYVRSPQPTEEKTGAGELEKTDPPTFRPVKEVGGKIDIDKVRDNYAAELKRVDAEIGRLLGRLESLGLANNTVVHFVSPTPLALGEHGVFGAAPAGGHEDAYRVAHMIRDPQGRRKGDESQFFASTHDIASTALSYLGVVAPGKMEGEDLIGLLDEEDPETRPYFSSTDGAKVVVGDGRYVMVSDFEGQEQRIFDTDPDQWHDDHHGDDDYVERDEDRDVSREEPARLRKLRAEALEAGRGTLPRFGPDGPIRPQEEVDDDDNPNDEGALDADDDLNFSGQ